MDIVIDRDSWRQPQAGSLAGREESRPDWHGLRSRLCAAYATRHMLAGEGKGDVGKGSFDRQSASVLAVYGHGLGTVNLTVLGNRKAPDGNDDAVAGEPASGDRGL